MRMARFVIRPYRAHVSAAGKQVLLDYTPCPRECAVCLPEQSEVQDRLLAALLPPGYNYNCLQSFSYT